MRTRDAELRELLDAQTLDDAALRRNLRDIRLINRLLGWTAFTVREVARHVRSRGMERFSLLDVASGSADMPLAVARWAARAGVRARIVATDVNPEIVAVAGERAAAMPAVTVERQDALALPYAPGSFDIALCTLALHHFDPPGAVELLENLARVGRQLMVFDSGKSPSSPAVTWRAVRPAIVSMISVNASKTAGLMSSIAHTRPTPSARAMTVRAHRAAFPGGIARASGS